MSLTRADLDALTCAGDNEHTGRLWLHSRCHTDVPTWATYEDGQLEITCAECAKPVAVIAVQDTQSATNP